MVKSNKLTLNYLKTTYLLFNEQPHGRISLTFSLHINQKEISTSESKKYLGVWFDDNLNWSAHIQKLSLQLARCCNMLYHIRDFVLAQALVSGTTDARIACSSIYSAIFQLTSAKFQTFAYNSRTVGSSSMKFGQQLEIIELYVCTKFQGNKLRDFGFRTRKPPRKFGLKSGLSQKRL